MHYCTFLQDQFFRRIVLWNFFRAYDTFFWWTCKFNVQLAIYNVSFQCMWKNWKFFLSTWSFHISNWKWKSKSLNPAETKITTEILVVDISKRCVWVIHLTPPPHPHSSFFSSLPSSPFPPFALLSHFSLSSSGTTLCHHRDDTWGSTSSGEGSEVESKNGARLHSLFTSLGIGILMLKAIGQPFIKLTRDVGDERRGWDGRKGGRGTREREREKITLC